MMTDAVGSPLRGTVKLAAAAKDQVGVPLGAAVLSRVVPDMVQARIARVGVDLAKRVFQVHAVDARGEKVLARSFAPEKFFARCAGLPAECMVAMETCGGSHHVARQLLRPALAEITGERQAGQGLPDVLRLCLQRLHLHWIELDLHLAWCDERITLHARQDAQARQAQTVPGVGVLTASALSASVVDFHQFRSAHQFGAWLGLVPKQNSSGGKERLGRITKAGDEYLRMLLIQGAKSVLMHAAHKTDRTSRWVLALRERMGWQKALVALAHKNASILWALLTSGELYRADPVSTPAHQAHGPQAQPLTH